MKYQCDQGHIFLHTATYISGNKDAVATGEVQCCPFCLKDTSIPNVCYTELAEENVANVYVYDLTTGPQTQLDQLLADGFKIVNRYSKQYHLEKPKAKVAPKDTDFASLCPQIQTCTHEKEARALKLEPNVPLPCDNKGEGCAYHMTAEAQA